MRRTLLLALATFLLGVAVGFYAPCHAEAAKPVGCPSVVQIP